MNCRPASVTSGLQSNSRNDPWISAYQNILEGGVAKPTKRMSLPAASAVTRPQPLVLQKQCHSCTKEIPQARVYSEPGKPSIIYCEKCYVEKFTKGSCPTCTKPVMSKTDPYITHNRQTWHAACFKCFNCHIDVAPNPMVDLRGRPCCEECLMAQSGTGHQEDDLPRRNSLSPGDRSLNDSPVPTSPLSRATRGSISKHDASPESEAQLPHNLSPLSLNMDPNLMSVNSPLSAKSISSQSSLSGSFRNNASSGYASGTSSTYSSVGRRRSDSVAPSPAPAASSANMLKVDLGSSGNSHLAYGRPGSALSIHSYNSSRSESPLPGTSDGMSKSQEEGESIHQTHLGQDSPSEPTLRQSRSRSMVVGMEDFGASVSRALQNNTGVPRASLSNTGSQNNSQPGTPGRKTPVLDRYPASSAADVDLVRPTENLTISTTAGRTPTRTEQPESMRPVFGRARSRSTVGLVSSASVRARTEALLNQAQAVTSPTTPRSTSHFSPNGSFTNGSFTNRRTSGVFKQPPPAAEKESKESKNASLEAEPNRPSLFRHGRQRSNTVGEAISLPTVSVDEAARPALSRTSIPEGHCHKCLERVTENGVRLQNGDRYHLDCFLCHGCKQIFTESEFHIVLGRPYHPGCVSMAAPTSIMGAITKCQKCHKIVANKSIRFSGHNYHPQCFTCKHCDKVLNSTSRFYEVDGQVECEQCCDERDSVRLPPKIVPVPRNVDHFPMPAMVVPTMDNNNRRGSVPLEPSGPGMIDVHSDLSRSGSGSSNGSSSPLRAPGSPSLPSPSSAINLHDSQELGGGAASPVVVMASPLVSRVAPPALTSFFSTRSSPLPKFGGTTNCPRCHEAVGVMDQVPGPKNEKWHKKCLNCVGCKKNLDSSALTRGEGEAFCRGCYNKTRVRAAA
ncbi:Cysteine-rich protein 2-binding protein [Mortierella sp. NVP85]|nr:Cysteine-rich protein 2-binding protein [Mortierella sp. NVP85]